MTGSHSRVLTGTLAYLLASVFWGLNIPLTSELLKHFDPFWVSPARYLIASTLLAVWLLVAQGPAALRSPIPLVRIGLLSLLVSSFLVLFTLGLYLANPITAAAVIAGSPVYVAIVSRLWTGAALERGFWGATALTILGAGIAIYGRAAAATTAGSQGLGLRGGELLIVLAIACWTVYSVLAQRWFTAEVSQLRRTFLSSLGAIPWLLLFWGLARGAGLVGPPNLHPTPDALANLAISAVFCTALATVCWNIGMSRLGISTGALWQNMVPVFGVLISLTLYGVIPTVQQVVGGLVVLTGVLYMQWHRLRAPE